MKNLLYFLWEVFKIVLIALLIVVPVRYFLFQPFLVRGASMEPNFQNGDYLIIDEITYRFRAPQRGEVIIFRYPLDPKEKYIKRIIGLPGETIEIGEGKVKIYTQKGVFILDESGYLPKSYTPGDLKINLDFNDYFVLGDNRSASLDSRRWGPLPQKYIIGRVFLRAWPLTAIEKFEAPVYQLLK